MRLSTFCGLHSDTEHLLYGFSPCIDPERTIKSAEVAHGKELILQHITEFAAVARSA
jgi:hypothetical protein